MFLLIPLSVVLVFVMSAAYWLALRAGQFDDLENPGLDIVLDDGRRRPVTPKPEATPAGHDAAPGTQ